MTANRINAFGQYIPIVLAIFFLFVYLSIAVQFSGMGMFRSWTVLFGADAGGNYGLITHGWGAPTFSHPGLGVLFSIPIRMVTTIIGMFSELPQQDIRQFVGLIVVPLIASCGVAVFYLLNRRLGFDQFKSLIITFAFGFSFSQLIFGATPDSFGISGALIVLLLYFSSYLREPMCGRKIFVYVLTSGLLVSITVTNIIVVFMVTLVYLFVTRELSIKVVIGRTIGVAFFALVFAYLTFLAHHAIYKQDVGSDTPGSRFSYTISGWLTKKPAERFFDFPLAVASSMAPGSISSEYDLNAEKNSDPFKYQLVVNKPSSMISEFATLLTFCMVLGLALIFIRNELDGLKKSAVISCFGIVLFNWIFHSFWGEQFFLYSQHWQVAIFIIIGYLLSKIRGDYVFILIAVVLFLIFNNARVGIELLSIVRAI